jgi:uncharacterized membrane protein
MMRVGERHLAKPWVNLLAVVVAVVSGVGIYIGRFFRYNSWEIGRIVEILRDLVASLSWDMVVFVLATAVLQLGLLVLLRPVFRHDILRKDLP